MAGYPVTGDQYRTIDRRMSDIKRQLCVKDGSPLDPQVVMDALQQIVEGNLDAIPQGLRRLIDCDASPWCPSDWKVESHRKGGQLEFDPAKIALHLDDRQKDDRIIVGNRLRKRLEGKQVLNACVLDHLLANTNLIPGSWKQDEQGHTRNIYFWGTVYRASSGLLYVRCLYWRDEWFWYYRWLDLEWGVRSHAVVSV